MERPNWEEKDRPVEEIEKATDDWKNKDKNRNITTGDNETETRPTGTDHPA